MGYETDQLGLLSWTQLNVWDLLQSLLNTLAVLDQDVVSRDHDLALGSVFRTLHLLCIDEVSCRKLGLCVPSCGQFPLNKPSRASTRL